MPTHYVIMGAMASQITSFTIVYLTVHSDAVQRKHQSSASQAFVHGIHRWPVNSPHKGPITRKMFPFDNVIMCRSTCMSVSISHLNKNRNDVRHICVQMIQIIFGLHLPSSVSFISEVYPPPHQFCWVPLRFPSQTASNADIVFMSWRRHER